METAILAVTIIGSFSLSTWFIRRGIIGLMRELQVISSQVASCHVDVDTAKFDVAEIKKVLTEASRLKSLKTEQSVFDGDKIPERSGGLRYTTVARRRAMAEMESLGPVTQKDKVRANNARAIESAG